jgi:hypothetical protein
MIWSDWGYRFVRILRFPYRITNFVLIALVANSIIGGGGSDGASFLVSLLFLSLSASALPWLEG